jgi:hypothetical protein
MIVKVKQHKHVTKTSVAVLIRQLLRRIGEADQHKQLLQAFDYLEVHLHFR